MSYLRNFGVYIWKIIAIFEISTHKLVKMQSSAQR